MKKYGNLVGKRFGKLVVISNEAHKKGHLVCQCDCGKIVEVRRGNLTSGSTRSCGSRECKRDTRHMEKHNPDIEVHTPEYVQEELQLEEMINTPFENRRRVSNINRIYNKAYELNKKPQTSTRNSSGYVGVFWDKKHRRWVAQIGFRGERIRIGSYQIFDDAVKARKEAEEMLFAPAILMKKKFHKKSYKCVDNGSVA